MHKLLDVARYQLESLCTGRSDVSPLAHLAWCIPFFLVLPPNQSTANVVCFLTFLQETHDSYTDTWNWTQWFHAPCVQHTLVPHVVVVEQSLLLSGS